MIDIATEAVPPSESAVNRSLHDRVMRCQNGSIPLIERGNAWKDALSLVGRKEYFQAKISQAQRPSLNGEGSVVRSAADDWTLAAVSPELQQAMAQGQVSDRAAFALSEYFIKSGYHGLNTSQLLELARAFPPQMSSETFEAYKQRVEAPPAETVVSGREPHENWEMRREILDVLEIANNIQTSSLNSQFGKTIDLRYFIPIAAEALRLVHQAGAPDGIALLDKYSEGKERMSQTGYRIIGERVTGAKHILDHGENAICEDALQAEVTPQGDQIVTIADGHGSKKHFRSSEGAQMAVDILAEELKLISEQYHLGNVNLQTATGLEVYVDNIVRRNIVNRWRDRINQELQGRSISENELATITDYDRDKQIAEIQQTPGIVYGSTLMGAMIIANKYLVLLQIGDGDILLVDKAGNTTEPIAHGAGEFANDTASLCKGDRATAANSIKVQVVQLGQYDDPMVMMSTDGYRNSFPNDLIDGKFITTQYYQAAVGYSHIPDNEIQNGLADKLKKTSQAGSGDDITLAFLRASWNPIE